MGATGLEPVTPSVSNAGASLENTANQGISARSADSCTTRCTNSLKLHSAADLDALAAALLALSPDECDRLAALVAMPRQSEGKDE
jgi:hypothetical protein